MRAGFLLAILLGASYFAWLAFAELDYLSSAGRLGPGFFPRIIGLALVALCAYSLYEEVRAGIGGAVSAYWRPLLVVAALSAAFVAALEPLGGLLAMAAFLGASLSYLNRGRHLQNAVLTLALPIGVYLLFRVWLNAALPRGLLPF